MFTHGWRTQKIDAVFLAAATVGGIMANATRPAEFLYENLVIETNVIHAAKCAGVKKLLFLGSSCIYPRMAEQPMKEEALLTGALEPTNEWYAIAKIAGIKLCAAYRRQYGCDFVSVMPTNLLRARRPLRCRERPCCGGADHEDPRRDGWRTAPAVELWGSGTPKREFLFTEDLADACVFVMKNYSEELFLNVGTGREMTILELAESIARVAGWKGTFTFDRSKPDGMPRKVMDVSRLQGLGWSAQTPFDDGIRQAYDWYVAHVANRAA